MKLLTADTGWASTGGHLFWTNSAGAHWKEITPPNRSRYAVIQSVFFLNTDIGWVLYRPGTDEAGRFSVASTTDAGVTWSITQVAIPAFYPETEQLTGNGQIAFADESHGWVNLGLGSGSAFRPGLMMMTSDGGQTWNRPAKDPLQAGSICVVNAVEVWLAGGPAEGELYVTRDSGQSWQQVSVNAPKEIYPATDATYDAPTFEDSEHGFLPVSFSGGFGEKSAAVLFATSDGGRTWMPESILPNLDDSSQGELVRSDVVDSTWIVAPTIDDRIHLMFSRFGSNAGTTEPSANADLLKSGISHLSFVTPTQGWMLTDVLLSTTDGGATWTNITPQKNAHGVVFKPLSSISPSSAPFPAAGTITPNSQTEIGKPEPKRASKPTASAMTSPQTSVGMNVGFDTQFVAPINTMLAWWNASPYFDVGFYLNGAASHKNDKNLTPSWITAISNQGWGLMPLWAGPQASCACVAGSGQYPNCTAFKHTIATGAKAAKAQGVAQADKAAASASALGLADTVIYYDMEQYTSSYCGASVTAFLNGWVSEVQTQGFYAGVYGSPANASTDWINVSPLPDDVWLATYNPNYDLVTVWALSGTGYSLDDSRWAADQRIRQYSENRSEKWGNVALNIDSDVVDADIVGGNGVKSYNFTTGTFDYPGATYTAAGAINNNNGVPNSLQTPQGVIVGFYIDTNGYGHGFVLAGTDFSSFDCVAIPGGTYPNGINNLGTISGSYSDANNVSHGFSYNGTSCTTIDYPGATNTYATAINDANWITGSYEDSSGDVHGFLYKYGQFYSFDYPGQTDTDANGINGLGQIVGTYYPTDSNALGFLDNAGSSDPNISINFTSIAYPAAEGTFVTGINNNAQIVGEVLNSTGQTGFLLNGGSFVPIPASASLSAINDETQVVGYQGVHGFLAVPQ